MPPGPDRPAATSQDDGLRLRDGSRSDALCVGVLATQVFLDTYATEGVTPALAWEVLEGYSPPAFDRRLADPRQRFVLAERQGHLVGFAELALGRPCPLDSRASAELVRLYVQPRFQDRGAGSALLQRVQVLATGAGSPALWLTAWEGNTRARTFWERRGFTDVGSTVHTLRAQAFTNRVLVAAPAARNKPKRTETAAR